MAQGPSVSVVQAAASRALLAWLLGVQADAVEQLDSGGPAGRPATDRGITRRAIGIDGPRADGYVISGALQASGERERILALHEGRRAGARQPPTAPLAEWAERKLGVSPEESRGVGFVIARAIGRRGIPANPFLRDPVERALPLLAPSVARAVAEATAEGFPPQTL